MAVAEPCGPVRPQRFDARQQALAACEFDRVTLAIVEAERFDMRKALQGPGQAGGGILSAGKQHQRGFGLEQVGHGRALAFPDGEANRWKSARFRRVPLGSDRRLRHKATTSKVSVPNDPFPRYFPAAR